MLILLTAIIFFYIGKYSQTRIEEQIVKDMLKKKSQVKAGVIPFKSSSELEYEKTVDKKIEEEWRKLPLVNG